MSASSLMAVRARPHWPKPCSSTAARSIAWDVSRMGRPSPISTPMRRNATSRSAPPCCRFAWRGHKINLLDAPGFADFAGDIRATMRVADAAIILVDAAAGVEVGTEQVWKGACQQQLSRLVYVNKMDRENADFSRAIASAQERLGSSVVPLEMPIGAESSFRGVIEVLHRRACFYAGSDGKMEEGPIPAELVEEVERYRAQLIERIAENDDALIEKFLNDEPIDDAELDAALQERRLRRDAGPRPLRRGDGQQGAARPPRCDRRLSARPDRERRGDRHRPARRLARRIALRPRREHRRRRLQDDRRSLRHPQLFPRLFRHRPRRHPPAERQQGAGRAARASLFPLRQGTLADERDRGGGYRRGRQAGRDLHRRHPLRYRAPGGARLHHLPEAALLRRRDPEGEGRYR